MAGKPTYKELEQRIRILEEECAKGKQTAEAIRASENHFRNLIDCARDTVFILDLTYNRIVDCNRQACLSLDYSRDEILQRSPADIEVNLSPKEIDAVHAELSREGTSFVEGVHRRKDGSEFPVDICLCLLDPPSSHLAVAIARDITERKRAETALRESESRYRTLFEGAQDGMAVADAETGILVDCNQALCRLVERERAEIVGQPQSILHPPQILVEGYSPSFRDHQRDPSGGVQEDSLLTKSGKIIPVEIRGSHICMTGQDYMLGVFRDTRERKRAEEALRKAERELKLVFDTVPATIWQRDLQGRYVQVNKTFSQTTGLSEEDMLGKTDHELYAAEIADQYVSVDRRIHLSGEPEFGILEEYRKPSGEQRWWRVDKLAYRDADDQVAGTIGFALDITEEKETKEVLRC